MAFSRQPFSLVALALCLGWSTGCGGPPVVRGKLVYLGEGKPFTAGGFVIFEGPAPTEANYVGTLDANGEFILNREGAAPLPGTYRVVVQPRIEQDGDIQDHAVANRERAKLVSSRSLDRRSTPLRCTIQPGVWYYIIEVEPPESAQP